MTPAPRLLIVGPYPPPFGGVSVHIRRLQLLLETNNIPYKITTRSKLVRSSRTMLVSSGRASYLIDVEKEARRSSIVHDHTEYYQWKSPILSPLFDTLVRNSPALWVLTIHDGTFSARLHHCSSFLRARIRSSLKKYAAIVVINEELSRSVQSLGVAPERVFLIKSFLPLEAGDRTIAQPARDFIKGHKPILVASGAFHPYYHFDIVAEAFRTIRLKLPDSGLIIIAGAFAVASDFRKRVFSTLGEDPGSSLVLHDVQPTQVMAILRKAGIFIRSAFPDGDGLSLREALQAGVPVVAADNGLRPDGVVTYSPLNAGDLAGKVLRTVKRGKTSISARNRTVRESRENGKRLLSLYESVVKSRQ